MLCTLALCMSLVAPAMAAEIEVVGQGAAGVSTTWTLYSDGTMTFSGEGAIDWWIDYYYTSQVKKIVIESGVTEIGGDMFAWNCPNLSGSLTIPDTVTSIGYSAFAGCGGLTGDLIIPDSVESIGNVAFSQCYGLNGNLKLSKSLETIGVAAFSNACFTGDLVIPNSVTAISYAAFNNCAGFDGELVIPDNAIAIGDAAFADCTGISKIDFKGKAPSEFGSNCFYNIEAKAYYTPDSSWTSDLRKDYGGDITWVKKKQSQPVAPQQPQQTTGS